MSTEDSLVRLLKDIRGVQREHLKLYGKNSDDRQAEPGIGSDSTLPEVLSDGGRRVVRG